MTEPVRPLPNNVEAEQAVLGSIIFNNQLYGHVASIISPEHFFEPVHRTIFEHVAARITAGDNVTPVTLKMSLPDVVIDEESGTTLSRYLAKLAAGHCQLHSSRSTLSKSGSSTTLDN
jgi:replicative DNA helicase